MASAFPLSLLITVFFGEMCHCHAMYGSTCTCRDLAATHEALLSSCKHEGMAGNPASGVQQRLQAASPLGRLAAAVIKGLKLVLKAPES